MLFSLNSTFMGGTITVHSSSKISLYLQVEDHINKISKVQFLTNQGKIIKEIKDIDLHNVKYIFEKEVSLNETWFVAKVYLNNNKEAMSSPIFVNYE